MDTLKGYFISGFIGFILIVLSYSCYAFFQDTNLWIWLGNILSYGVGVGYFAGIYIFPTPRTSQNMTVLWSIIFLGTAVVIAGTVLSPELWLPLLLNISMIGGWYLYIRWISYFSARDKNTLKVGKSMPNVTLKNANGDTIELKSFFNTPAIFLFYRGNWCPFCVAQIKELANEYQKIQEKGASLVFISPQSPRHTNHLAKKFDIPANFLIDEDLKAAKELNLFHKHGTPAGMEVLGFEADNVLPTLIVTDHQGIIRFADLTDNYRLRPEPSIYLELLEGL